MIKSLIDNLTNDVYCRIKASKKHGVGVFAIKDIPKDEEPFKPTNSKYYNGRVLNIKASEIEKLDSGVKNIIKDFYHEENGNYGIPYRGPNSNDISYYMNTSKNPNIGFKSSKKSSMIIFVTLRKIKKGEELLINYDNF
jgi:SET domain-containing protein